MDKVIKTDCCIVGAGPAGLMLGLLLARAGINVTILEKHEDFFRDFRGDTIHPSTLDVLDHLGMLDEVLQLPHQKAHRLHAEVDGRDVVLANFSKLPIKSKFIAFMPQWDFLNFLSDKANETGHFNLIMGAKACDLVQENNCVKGISFHKDGQLYEVRAPLTIAADGRNSTLRDKAGLEVESFGAPTDVLWMKVSHQREDPEQAMGHVGPKQGFVMIDRGEYWQCGYVIKKQSFEELKAQGIEHLRQLLAESAPFPIDRFDEIESFDQVHLLSVRIDRLKQWWKTGFLCIGDAAHAMSPIGGVGVNLAIQDAVAAANILAPKLFRGTVEASDLARVQKRRSFPTKATQKIQIMMRGKRRNQDKGHGDGRGAKSSGVMKKIGRMPWLAHVAGRLMGMGFRPERPDPIFCYNKQNSKTQEI